MTLYLDANASEPLRPEARQAMLAALDAAGNPSSVHAAGRAARRILEAARLAVADRFGAAPGDVVFTAGGTEANAAAVKGLAGGRRVLAGATEHPAILASAIGAAIIPVARDGTVDLGALTELLRDGPPALVCLMLANNETGVLHPIPQAAALCRAHGALLHVDAVQAAGRMDFSLATLGADALAVSGHKLGGPKGAAALLLRNGLALPPLIPGGMAAALASAAPDPRIGALRDRIEAACVARGAIVAGTGAPRLPNTASLILPGVAAETQVIALDLAGMQVSAGAACSSGKVARSHVLAAMGLGADAACAIRVSLPWNAPDDAAERFVSAWSAMRDRLSRAVA
jgi:cysteine desulfurase